MRARAINRRLVLYAAFRVTIFFATTTKTSKENSNPRAIYNHYKFIIMVIRPIELYRWPRRNNGCVCVYSCIWWRQTGHWAAGCEAWAVLTSSVIDRPDKPVSEALTARSSPLNYKISSPSFTEPTIWTSPSSTSGWVLWTSTYPSVIDRRRNILCC